MYLQKVISQKNLEKNLEKNLFFVGILTATDEKSRIRIRKSVVWIRIRTTDLQIRIHNNNTN